MRLTRPWLQHLPAQLHKPTPSIGPYLRPGQHLRVAMGSFVQTTSRARTGPLGSDRCFFKLPKSAVARGCRTLSPAMQETTPDMKENCYWPAKETRNKSHEVTKQSKSFLPQM